MEQCQINEKGYSIPDPVVKLPDGRFLVVYQSNGTLYGRVLSAQTNFINSSWGLWNINVEANELVLAEAAMDYNAVKMTALPDGRVAVYTFQNYATAAIIVTISQSENGGTVAETEQHDGLWDFYGGNPKLLTLTDGTVMVWYITSAGGVLNTIRSGKQAGHSNGRMDGIAKTGGYAGGTIEVYVPW